MRTVDVIVTLLAATDKLVLVSLHGDRDNAVWFHRDAISIAGLIESDHNCIITLSAQLARKKEKWRTGLVTQMRTLYSEVNGRDGSLAQIEKWMRSLDGKKRFDDWRILEGRIKLNNELP